jgi:hypothetical protein
VDVGQWTLDDGRRAVVLPVASMKSMKSMKSSHDARENDLTSLVIWIVIDFGGVTLLTVVGCKFMALHSKERL